MTAAALRTMGGVRGRRVSDEDVRVTSAPRAELPPGYAWPSEDGGVSRDGDDFQTLFQNPRRHTRGVQQRGTRDLEEHDKVANSPRYHKRIRAVEVPTAVDGPRAALERVRAASRRLQEAEEFKAKAKAKANSKVNPKARANSRVTAEFDVETEEARVARQEATRLRAEEALRRTTLRTRRERQEKAIEQAKHLEFLAAQAEAIRRSNAQAKAPSGKKEFRRSDPALETGSAPRKFGWQSRARTQDAGIAEIKNTNSRNTLAGKRTRNTIKQIGSRVDDENEDSNELDFDADAGRRGTALGMDDAMCIDSGTLGRAPRVLKAQRPAKLHVKDSRRTSMLQSKPALPAVARVPMKATYLVDKHEDRVVGTHSQRAATEQERRKLQAFMKKQRILRRKREQEEQDRMEQEKQHKINKLRELEAHQYESLSQSVARSPAKQADRYSSASPKRKSLPRFSRNLVRSTRSHSTDKPARTLGPRVDLHLDQEAFMMNYVSGSPRESAKRMRTTSRSTSESHRLNQVDKVHEDTSSGLSDSENSDIGVSITGESAHSNSSGSSSGASSGLNSTAMEAVRRAAQQVAKAMVSNAQASFLRNSNQIGERLTELREHTEATSALLQHRQRDRDQAKNNSGSHDGESLLAGITKLSEAAPWRSQAADTQISSLPDSFSSKHTSGSTGINDGNMDDESLSSEGADHLALSDRVSGNKVQVFREPATMGLPGKQDALKMLQEDAERVAAEMLQRAIARDPNLRSASSSTCQKNSTSPAGSVGRAGPVLSNLRAAQNIASRNTQRMPIQDKVEAYVKRKSYGILDLYVAQQEAARQAHLDAAEASDGGSTAASIQSRSSKADGENSDEDIGLADDLHSKQDPPIAHFAGSSDLIEQASKLLHLENDATVKEAIPDHVRLHHQRHVTASDEAGRPEELKWDDELLQVPAEDERPILDTLKPQTNDSVHVDNRGSHDAIYESEVEEDEQVKSCILNGEETLQTPLKTQESQHDGTTSSASHSEKPRTLSPGALRRKLLANVNLLETLEQTHQHLNELEHAQALSLAQHETAALMQQWDDERRHAAEVAKIATVYQASQDLVEARTVEIRAHINEQAQAQILAAEARAKSLQDTIAEAKRRDTGAQTLDKDVRDMASDAPLVDRRDAAVTVAEMKPIYESHATSPIPGQVSHSTSPIQLEKILVPSGKSNSMDEGHGRYCSESSSGVEENHEDDDDDNESEEDDDESLGEDEQYDTEFSTSGFHETPRSSRRGDIPSLQGTTVSVEESWSRSPRSILSASGSYATRSPRTAAASVNSISDSPRTAASSARIVQGKTLKQDSHQESVEDEISEDVEENLDSDDEGDGASQSQSIIDEVDVDRLHSDKMVTLGMSGSLASAAEGEVYSSFDDEDAEEGFEEGSEVYQSSNRKLNRGQELDHAAQSRNDEFLHVQLSAEDKRLMRELVPDESFLRESDDDLGLAESEQDADGSFRAFTKQLLRNYRKNAATRRQHEQELLKMREKALREKTREQLKWLIHQKKLMIQWVEDRKTGGSSFRSGDSSPKKVGIMSPRANDIKMPSQREIEASLEQERRKIETNFWMNKASIDSERAALTEQYYKEELSYRKHKQTLSTLYHETMQFRQKQGSFDLPLSSPERDALFLKAAASLMGSDGASLSPTSPAPALMGEQMLPNITQALQSPRDSKGNISERDSIQYSASFEDDGNVYKSEIESEYDSGTSNVARSVKSADNAHSRSVVSSVAEDLISQGMFDDDDEEVIDEDLDQVQKSKSSLPSNVYDEEVGEELDTHYEQSQVVSSARTVEETTEYEESFEDEEDEEDERATIVGKEKVPEPLRVDTHDIAASNQSLDHLSPLLTNASLPADGDIRSSPIKMPGQSRFFESNAVAGRAEPASSSLSSRGLAMQESMELRAERIHNLENALEIKRAALGKLQEKHSLRQSHHDQRKFERDLEQEIMETDREIAALETALAQSTVTSSAYSDSFGSGQVSSIGASLVHDAVPLADDWDQMSEAGDINDDEFDESAVALLESVGPNERQAELDGTEANENQDSNLTGARAAHEENIIDGQSNEDEGEDPEVAGMIANLAADSFASIDEFEICRVRAPSRVGPANHHAELISSKEENHGISETQHFGSEIHDSGKIMLDGEPLNPISVSIDQNPQDTQLAQEMDSVHEELIRGIAHAEMPEAVVKDISEGSDKESDGDVREVVEKVEEPGIKTIKKHQGPEVSDIENSGEDGIYSADEDGEHNIDENESFSSLPKERHKAGDGEFHKSPHQLDNGSVETATFKEAQGGGEPLEDGRVTFEARRAQKAELADKLTAMLLPELIQQAFSKPGEAHNLEISSSDFTRDAKDNDVVLEDALEDGIQMHSKKTDSFLPLAEEPHDIAQSLESAIDMAQGILGEREVNDIAIVESFKTDNTALVEDDTASSFDYAERDAQATYDDTDATGVTDGAEEPEYLESERDEDEGYYDWTSYTDMYVRRLFDMVEENGGRAIFEEWKQAVQMQTESAGEALDVSFYLEMERADKNPEYLQINNKMLFDLVNSSLEEILLGQRYGTKIPVEKSGSWAHVPFRQAIRLRAPVPPLETLVEDVLKRVLRWDRLESGPSIAPVLLNGGAEGGALDYFSEVYDNSRWSSSALWTMDPYERLENVICSDLLERDEEWMQSEQEEWDIISKVADLMLDDLVKETAQYCNGIFPSATRDNLEMDSTNK